MRGEAWRIIRQRPDIVLRLLTKRASRIKECLPKDWGDGYEYHIPDKQTQSLQAYKSGLSYKGKNIDFKLTNQEPGFFAPSPNGGG